MTVREYVYTLLVNDDVMNDLGFTAANVHANGVESPNTDRFAILRWGTELPTPGRRGPTRVTERTASLWVYEINPDLQLVAAVLKRWCMILDATFAVKTGPGSGDGYITQCDWDGDSDDAWDDVYERHVRSSTYRIIASGD